MVRISSNAGLARCTYRLRACLKFGPRITSRSVAGASAVVTWSLIAVKWGPVGGCDACPLRPADPDAHETSRSSGLPIVFGTTYTGRFIAVVFEEIDADTVKPVTAYDIKE